MSHYRVTVKVDTEASLPEPAGATLKQAADLTLKRHGLDPGTELGIVLVDAEQMRHLNQQFRGVDAPTDVLSFAMNESLPEGHDYLGDVVIAVQVAQDQARESGHDFVSELSLLVVHGVLHLLGYDHATADERTAMWGVQDEILTQMGLNVQPTEE